MNNLAPDHLDTFVRRATEAMGKLDPSSPKVPLARSLLHVLALAHGTTRSLLSVIPNDTPRTPESYLWASLGEAVRVEEFIAQAIEEIVNRESENVSQ